MNRILLFTITALLYLTFYSPIRAQSQQDIDMVKLSNFWLVDHNEIEKVINLMYYSWVNGDGNTFLSCFTPDVTWYGSYASFPDVYHVLIPNKDALKTKVADKAKEVKETFTGRWLVVNHIHVSPENSEKWIASGEAGNAIGIATAGVDETTLDKKTGVTTLHFYTDTYMMKSINGKWMISGGIRKLIEPPYEALFFGIKD